MEKRFTINNINHKQLFIIASAVFAIAFFVLAKKFLFFFGPDFVGYVGIAKHYANGDFYKAVNTWWCPLYSWCMVPMLWLKMDPLWINKIIQFATGVYALYTIYKLLHLFIKQKNAALILVAFIPFVLYWSLISDTPDFMAAILLVHFFYLSYLAIDRSSKRNSVLMGLIGGVAFLAKSFNFFFLIGYSVALICFLIFTKKRIVWRNFVATSVSYFIVLALWVASMYFKTNILLLTSRSEAIPCYINHPNINQSNIQLYDCGGPVIDSNSFYSNWEQPNLYTTVSYWTAYNEAIDVFLRIIENSKTYLHQFISIYHLVILLVALFLFRKNFRTSVPFLLFISIYLMGHFIFHLEPRFFIMPQLLIMSAVVISVSKITNQFLPKLHYVLYILIVVLLSKTPILQIIQAKPDIKVTTMKGFSEAQEFNSNAYFVGDVGLFDEALYLSYFNNGKCLGSITPNNTTVTTKPYYFVSKNKGQYQVTEVK